VLRLLPRVLLRLLLVLLRHLLLGLRHRQLGLLRGALLTLGCLRKYQQNSKVGW
jgi:hypothetical protein